LKFSPRFNAGGVPGGWSLPASITPVGYGFGANFTDYPHVEKRLKM